MYLPTLTDDELLSYAGTLQLTPLEAELVRRFEDFKAENHGIEQELEKMEERYEEAAQALHEEISYLQDEITAAQDKIEDLEEELAELKGTA